MNVNDALTDPAFSHVLRGIGAYSRAFLVYHRDIKSPTGTKIVASYDLSEIMGPIKHHGVEVVFAKDKK
jgi:hypothetical protein